MTSFEITAKANLALVLPNLLITGHLEQTSLLKNVTMTFKDESGLTGNESLQLVLENGKTFTSKAIIPYLTELANSNASTQRTSSVRIYSYDIQRLSVKCPDIGSIIGQRSESFAIIDFQSLRKPLDESNYHLKLRTHIVGYTLSVADLAVWATIRGNRIAQSLIKKTTNIVSRWYTYIEVSNPWITETAVELTTYASKERAALSAAGATKHGGSYGDSIPA